MSAVIRRCVIEESDACSRKTGEAQKKSRFSIDELEKALNDSMN